MLDYSIEIDVEVLPKRLQDIILELHRLDKEDDWLNYSFKAEELEIVTKGYVVDGKMTASLFDKICMKYCGYEV